MRVNKKRSETINRGKRDFMHILAASSLCISGAFMGLPLIGQMAPARDVSAAGVVDVDIGAIPKGAQMRVLWQNKPVFIRHRTQEEVKRAVDDDLDSMRDHQKDSDRVIKDVNGVLRTDYLIVVGICTHLGCVPVGGLPGEEKGEFDGWFCPCHGSHYDISGRIRRGPAATNLVVPPYKYLSEDLIRLGVK